MDSHLTVKIKHPITNEDLVAAVLSAHPECGFGVVVPGLEWLPLQITRVVHCYRTEECYLAEEKPLYESRSFAAEWIEIDETDVTEAEAIIAAGTKPESVIARAKLVVERYAEAVMVENAKVDSASQG